MYVCIMWIYHLVLIFKRFTALTRGRLIISCVILHLQIQYAQIIQIYCKWISRIQYAYEKIPYYANIGSMEFRMFFVKEIRENLAEETLRSGSCSRWFSRRYPINPLCSFKVGPLTPFIERGYFTRTVSTHLFSCQVMWHDWTFQSSSSRYPAWKFTSSPLAPWKF